ncbi:hypothetical protein CC85DRAFT_300219 [Cutaneotrichosporon oleaginosum]|uniref:BTB domain-containing protein n=1 Tax=Cutaneotrichosporon oleaginosum TaxID=879819 RepID=A0A0J0XUC7_9TREE|nr:uncharacterized protein CC85DRAFT_300219 [Cutaneotrichosporon oleaginosum]KLT44670.1 hypothetical protein CC85DRAFT_300219 [Cutaneotrichosporon oleaginosum]TXT07657.1 hypothetical protein COLE_04581 [Cutaneotrichosporon oleaginosum]
MNPTPPPDASSRHPSLSSEASGHSQAQQYAPLAAPGGIAPGMVATEPSPPYSHTPPPGHPFMQSPIDAPPAQVQQHPQAQYYAPFRPISLTSGGRVAARVLQRAQHAAQNAQNPQNPQQPPQPQQPQQQQQQSQYSQYAQHYHHPQPQQNPPPPQQAHVVQPPQQHAVQYLPPQQGGVHNGPQPTPGAESHRLSTQTSGPRGRPSLPILPQGQQTPPGPIARAMSPASNQPHQDSPPQPLQPQSPVASPTSEPNGQPAAPTHSMTPPAALQQPQQGQDPLTRAQYSPQPLSPQQQHFVPRPPSALYAQFKLQTQQQASQQASQHAPLPALPEGAEPNGAAPSSRLAHPAFTPQLPSTLYASQPATPAAPTPHAPPQEDRPPSPAKPYPYPMSPYLRDRPVREETDVDLPGVTMHFEFSHDGDVVLVCPEGPTSTGFMVRRSALSRVSPVFATLLSNLEPTRVPTLALADSGTDMALFLHALVYGAVGAPHSRRTPPTVAEYLILHHLYTKYAVRPFLLAMLRHRIAERGHELAAPLANQRPVRSEITGYLRLAAACCSPRLWNCALKYARTWQYFVSPWSMGERDIAEVGEDAYAVILALEGLRHASGENTWTDLRVLYKGRTAGVARANDETVFWIEDVGSQGHAD